jgi:hypothetical protein
MAMHAAIMINTTTIIITTFIVSSSEFLCFHQKPLGWIISPKDSGGIPHQLLMCQKENPQKTWSWGYYKIT